MGPLLQGIGGVRKPYAERITEELALLPGDLDLAPFESDPASQWNQCPSGNERAFQLLSAFGRIAQRSAKDHTPDLVLVDLGPNLGAINRAARPKGPNCCRARRWKGTVAGFVSKPHSRYIGRMLNRLAIVLFLVAGGGLLAADDKGHLSAGAARIDITPPADAALPMAGYGGRTEGHQGIHDPLFVRAIALSDGSAQAAIVTWDLIGIPHPLWERYSARIAETTGIPREHILMAATHTHGGPDIRRLSGMAPETPGARYMEQLERKTIDAVRQAQAALRPARIGYGAGKAGVNINRRARMADGDWWLGLNPDGPSDKTVGVVRLETPDGEPLALLINYAVHGTVLGGKNLQITADLPGAVSRFVEKRFDDRLVALFTAGASGDQDPIYRVGTSFDDVAALGRILGEEVLRVANDIRTSAAMRIRGAQKVVACPGKKSPDGPRRRRDGNYTFVDADPVDIRLSVLLLNHIAIAGVSGEVLTLIGTRLKDESPFSRTLFVTHANGSSGYLPNDAAYDQISYEIVTARVRRGCAENAIVNGLLEMMDGL